GEAYTLLRDNGLPSPGALPLLGGGQSGAMLAFRTDPYAARPLDIIARANIAHRDQAGATPRLDDGSAGAALGLRWRPLPGVPVEMAGGRLFALGQAARDAWTLRAAGGIDSPPPPAAGLGFDHAAYAEAGMVGLSRRDLYASGQTRLGVSRRLSASATLSAGAGAWASIQRSDRTIGRADVGPSVRLGMAVAP